MALNTHETNTSPTFHLGYAEHTAYGPGKICCGCDMQFSSVSVHSMCFNCSHEMCRACPTIDFGSHSHDLRLHDTAHEGHDTSLKKTTPILSGLSQAQDANRHDGPYVRGRAGDGANSEQDHQMQPHGEHFETQQTLPVPGRNKRKLNMTKCERCRTDKKACVRQRLEKCNRCIEKGLLCSEATRATRRRKLASRSMPPIHNEIPPSADPNLFETRLKQWTLLAGYYKMMTRAQERLSELHRDITVHFSKHLDYRGIEEIIHFLEFVRFTLPKALLQFSKEILATDNSSKALPGRFWFANLNVALVSPSMDYMCAECLPTWFKGTAEELWRSLDACAEFLIHQHKVAKHHSILNPRIQDEHENIWERDRKDYIRISSEVLQEVEDTLQSFGMYEEATYARSIGLYHTDIWSGGAIFWYTEIDCLRRTPLHRLLDGTQPETIAYVSWKLSCNELSIDEWNSQDVLERTPLHILCQFPDNSNLDRLMPKVLEVGANPGLETIYGSLPLHYAAASGSVERCKYLMEYEFKIGAEDNGQRTALDYAIIKKHEDVVDLLTDRYLKAGLGEALAKAGRIATAVKEGTYKPWEDYSENTAHEMDSISSVSTIPPSVLSDLGTIKSIWIDSYR